MGFHVSLGECRVSSLGLRVYGFGVQALWRRVCGDKVRAVAGQAITNLPQMAAYIYVYIYIYNIYVYIYIYVYNLYIYIRSMCIYHIYIYIYIYV